ncbi:MAG: hypothetical protein LBO63_03115 [Oscillospiraceae bacterium]|jgi:hypothetical protein|nr:hypothetical protein [Oscillospiraceae bacterium]
MSKLTEAEKKIETAVVGGYKAVENGFVKGYQKIEDGVVAGYKKVEDTFVKAFLPSDEKPAEKNSTEKEATAGDDTPIQN